MEDENAYRNNKTEDIASGEEEIDCKHSQASFFARAGHQAQPSSLERCQHGVLCRLRAVHLPVCLSVAGAGGGGRAGRRVSRQGIDESEER